MDPSMAFCAVVDRNGYLPVHNKIYSHPQRPGDVAWNTANCRNRRMFNDTTGLAAAHNTRAYLIQSYLRDMGNGVKIRMREIDVPIRVSGLHWGGFRTAYKLDSINPFTPRTSAAPAPAVRRAAPARCVWRGRSCRRSPPPRRSGSPGRWPARSATRNAA